MSKRIEFKMPVAGCGALAGRTVTFSAPVAGPHWCEDDPIPGPVRVVDCDPMPDGWAWADVVSLWATPARDYYIGRAYCDALEALDQ